MSWLGDALKHLELSKKFTAAIFVSSLVMLGGPQLLPNALDQVPTQWRWLVSGACVFSGALLVFWVVPPTWRWITRVPSNLRNNPRINVPTPEENEFLGFLGEFYPNEQLDLRGLRRENKSKLEVLELCASLHRKGLVVVNEYNDNLVNLTTAGRKHALQILRAKT